MNNQTLPLPNPGDWCSILGATRLLRVSRRTVERMIIDGRLKGYLPHGDADRVANRILWLADVKDLAEALERVRGRAKVGADG